MRPATIARDVKPSAKFRLKTAAPEVQVALPETKDVRFLRRILMGLVVLLTFEGLVRKLEPGTVAVVIFLLKDFIILFMGLLVATRHKLPSAISHITVAYLIFSVLLLPNILVTFSHDPILAVFGAKEYLLYPIVCLAIFAAFQDAPVPRLMRFCRFVSILMIPTGIVGLIQTQLPASSWLNMSVDGTSLEGFSAAGHLRISSTFSFVSQFCIFLNMQMYMTFFALHDFNKIKNLLYKLVLLAPIPLLVVCSYCTGSRGAVMGNGLVLVIAVGLACVRFEFGKLMRFILIGGVIAGVALAFQALFPTLMATYSVREKGHVFGVSSEIQERVFNAMFGWVADTSSVPFFGNGLGIMSNGSDSLSSYARTFRGLGEWTETDFSSTLFEGGPYLMAIWYGFRYWIVLQTTLLFLFQTKRAYFLPGAFCQADVILVGVMCTLGIQPPIAIWWWLTIGLSTVLWWRSLHPLEEAVAVAPPKPTKTGVRPIAAPAPVPTAPVAVAPRSSRGRSAYADRLHKES